MNLDTRYDARKSFYGKARVEQEPGELRLISYSTHVASIVDGQAYVYGTYSVTTLRHIKEFLKQHNFKADNARQIRRDYDPNRFNESF